ncbi:MAG: CvpA family protein [Eubacterium sp.]|nr:CvpA family protein [Eubacterium sp.]
MSDKMPNMDYDADEVIENFKSKLKWPKKDDTVEVVVTPPNIGMKILLSIAITIVAGAVVYYAFFPALNLKATDFYMYLFSLLAIFMVAFYTVCGARKKIERKEYVKRKSVVPIIIAAVLLLVMLVGWLVGASLFRARDYAELMSVETSDFSEDFESINYDEVPRLDSVTAKVLADQQLGYLDEYMSQYVVTQNSTQINYNGTPVRVAYLEYADFFRWLNNTKDGLPAYMLIDLVSQKVQVVNCIDQFGEGIKYSPTELFNEKLLRHLRFQYPTALMDTPNFEIDDNAHPYWITPVLDKTIGLFGGTDVKGVIITDALNGESDYYSIDTVRSDSSLNWIDVVYSEHLVVQQYNYHGRLSHGFWNSVFFQKDVNVTSNGSGNIALDDDVWVYTGVTSSESDASNFGFILVNQRTKETRYYKNGGAMESSAQQSARDAVQNYGYNAIFPILLDIEGQPTYFMSLYGDSYTVKGYALVNLEDKTIVGTGLLDVAKSDAKALNAAVENYIDALKDKGKVDESANAEDYKVDETEAETPAADETPAPAAETTQPEQGTVTGVITDIKTSVNDGNTVYYLQLDGGTYYYLKVTDAMEVLLLNVGDTVTVTADAAATGSFVPATGISQS